MFGQRQVSNPSSYNLPSADPKMWAGSYVAQTDAQAQAVAAQSEDVDMEAASYIAAHPEYEQAEATAPVHAHTQRYLTLDTNVLISRLDTVKKVFECFSAETQNPISLLIPVTVINELDNKKQDLNSHLAYSARQATAWLLDVNRQKRLNGYGAIRCQKWSERGQTHQKADDRIVECAKVFSKMGGAEGMMWTEDGGLSLRALTEGVPSLPSPTPHISVILEQCGVTGHDTHASTDERTAAPSAGSFEAANDGSDDDMQIETDLYPSATPQPPCRISPTTKPSSPTRPVPRRNSSTSAPSTPSSTRSAPPRTTNSNTPSYLPSRVPSSRPPIPTNILARLTLLANLILSEVQPSPSPSPPPYSPSTPTTLSTQSAFASLEAALNKLRPPDGAVTESTRSLYRLLAMLQTLSSWVRPAHRQSQVLSGEAAKALEGVLEVLPEGGVYLADEDQWWELVSLIRAM